MFLTVNFDFDQTILVTVTTVVKFIVLYWSSLFGLLHCSGQVMVKVWSGEARKVMECSSTGMPVVEHQHPSHRSVIRDFNFKSFWGALVCHISCPEQLNRGPGHSLTD